MRKTGLFENGLIWFGAGVSIAEILTGTYFTSLGFVKGLAAILLGHVIGCTMFFLTGLIGACTGKGSMEATKMSFGNKGCILFILLNILQLVGWTGIMIYDGALAARELLGIGKWFWCLIIGGMIILWILIGIRNLGKINVAAMAALFVLTVIMSVKIFGSGGNETGGVGIGEAGNALSFGAAVELGVAMPLSWLPLVSDYTREAEKPVKATAVSTIVYGIVSCWMYLVGMGAAIFTGESDIARIILKAGLGIAGLVIIVFSTVTTTFLDAYSVGVSGESICSSVKGKQAAIAATVLGTVGAILFPMDNITDFLYLIGSVFAPMVAIQLAEFYVLKRNFSDRKFMVCNLVVWAAGFVLYRVLMNLDLPLGNTLPDMVITFALCILVGKTFAVRGSSQICENGHWS